MPDFPGNLHARTSGLKAGSRSGGWKLFFQRSMRTAAMFALSMLILSGCSFTGGFGGERYALVYGIGSYNNISNLPFAAQDGVDMRQTLVAQGYTVLSTHSGPEVTRSELLEDIRMAADIITENDVLFLYYAGHGSQSTSLDAEGDFQRTEYLVFSDYSSGSGDGLLSTDDFYTELSGISALHVSIVMDACNSGGFLPPDTYGVDALPTDYRHPIALSDDGSSGYLDAFRDFFSKDGYGGISMISAAGADEFSYEWTDVYANTLNIPDEYRDNGIFTGFFLEASAVNDRGHMNGDANSDGALTLQEAYAYSFTRLDESWNSYWRRPENMFQTTPEGDDPVYYPHISGGTVDPVIFRLEWQQ